MIHPFRDTSPDSFAQAPMNSLATIRRPGLQVRSWSYHILMVLVLGGQVLMRLLRGRVQRHRVMEQMMAAGPGALLPVVMINVLAGMIFTIQTAREMMRLGFLQALGGAFALGFCRELAPILSAAILAGQVGSAFAAEIGSMKITEQIDALKVLRTDPIDYLVVPRTVACCVMLPILTLMGLVLGVGGGVLLAQQLYQVEPSIFLDSVQAMLEPSDLLTVVIKSIIFGALIALSGCSWGLTTTSTKHLGQSATSAVVMTWIALFLVDLLITLLVFHGVQTNY
ncbi:MAG: MlaE family lipid ABC transporter permease subunit [Leptolyngbyaceae cyanobacterium]